MPPVPNLGSVSGRVLRLLVGSWGLLIEPGLQPTHHVYVFGVALQLLLVFIDAWVRMGTGEQFLLLVSSLHIPKTGGV